MAEMTDKQILQAKFPDTSESPDQNGLILNNGADNSPAVVFEFNEYDSLVGLFLSAVKEDRTGAHQRFFQVRAVTPAK